MTEQISAIGRGRRRFGAAAGACLGALLALTLPLPAQSQDAPQSVALGKYLSALIAGSDRDIGAAVDFYAEVVAADPENMDLLATASLFMLSDGQVDKAVAAAERLLEARPEEATALTLAAVGEVKAGDFAAANTSATEIPYSGVNRLLAPLVEAWTLAGQDRIDDALVALDKLVANASYDPFRQYHAALIKAYGDRPEAAEEEFAAMLAAGTASRGIEAYARFLESLDRVDEAATLYRNYLGVAPDDQIIAAELARVEAGDKAAPFIPDAAAGVAEVFEGLAAAMTQENALNPARNFAQLALYLRPDLEPAMIALANTMEQEELWEQANEVLSRVAPESPYNWGARKQIAANLGRMDETAAAAEILEAMAAERPDRIDVLISLGDILRGAQRFDESVAAYDRAVDQIVEPQADHWVLLYTRGTVLERSGNWDRAEADFLEALELQPDQPFVLNYLGYSWIELGVNVEEATAMIERAVEQRPTAGFIVDSLGWGHYVLGNYEEAARQLERAVQLTPSDSTINEHLGDAYWRVGRRREAVFQWRNALDLGPEEDQIPVITRKLEQGLDI